jgi:adenylosuccinate synthase
VPAGIFNPDTVCVIGAGVALNPQILLEEIAALEARGVEVRNLIISERTHLVMPYHLLLDEVEERARGLGKIGTTGRGIGPAYHDKVGRVGLRAGDLLDAELLEQRLGAAVERKNRLLERLYDAEPLNGTELFAKYQEIAERVRPYIADPATHLDRALREDQTILIEGAHGTLLDLDYGTFPYVTTSSPTVAGLLLGAGIGPGYLTTGLGVFKAYQSRVGAGPMPTELQDEIGDEIRRVGHEYGTTTGRPRRCGWFDAVAARHAVRINGFNSLALTRLDILDGFADIKVCTAYELNGKRVDTFPARTEQLELCRPIYEELAGWQEPITGSRRWDELPTRAQAYVQRISELLEVPVGIIGVGEGREQSIVLEASLVGSSN